MLVIVIVLVIERPASDLAGGDTMDITLTCGLAVPQNRPVLEFMGPLTDIFTPRGADCHSVRVSAQAAPVVVRRYEVLYYVPWGVGGSQMRISRKA